MSITFTAEVTGSRDFDKYTVVSVKYQPESRKYPQYIDLKFPAGEAPAIENGDEVEVTFGYLPDARGWESNKVDPSGKPYINGTVVLWKPKVSISGGSGAVEPDTFEEDIPF